jgi:phosphoesterase RecJ-like protein
MIPTQEIEQFWDAVLKAKTVLLCAHLGPDGDTLGSVLGLAKVLEDNFHHLEQIDVSVSGHISPLYSFMPGIQSVKNSEHPDELLSQYDLAISSDCGSLERLGQTGLWFSNAKYSINVDHHYSNSKYASLNIIDDLAGATGEVMLELINARDLLVAKEAAVGFYVAILTDTGGFKYGSTSANIFRLAAQLVEAGADPEFIYRKMYEECPKAQLLLHADAIEKASFELDSRLAWVVIDNAMLKAHNATSDHIEGLVESLRRVETVLVSVVLRETITGGTKVSLRSDSHEINVAEILATFGGGGHRMAAGVVVKESPDQFIQKLLPLLQNAILDSKAVAR